MNISYSKNTSNTSNTSTNFYNFCIVGAGFAGIVLALLLAKQKRDKKIIILEKNNQFASDFRGDTLYPNTLKFFENIGLVEKILQLPHRKIKRLNFNFDNSLTKEIIDIGGTNKKYSFIAVFSRIHLFTFLIEEILKNRNVQIVMGAKVDKLIEENGIIKGVQYFNINNNQRHKIRAELTIGADGNHSCIKQLSKLKSIFQKKFPAQICLWKTKVEEPYQYNKANIKPETIVGSANGNFAGAAFLDVQNEIQLICITHHVRAIQNKEQILLGIRQAVNKLCFNYALEEISWNKIKILPVEDFYYLRRSYKNGLVLIGDAAHNTPLFPKAIDFAIQDALALSKLIKNADNQYQKVSLYKLDLLYKLRIIKLIPYFALFIPFNFLFLTNTKNSKYFSIVHKLFGKLISELSLVSSSIATFIVNW